MAKQLNVNLAFNAETAQAKKAIEDLSQSLRKIQVQPSRMFDDTNLKKASQAAQDLEKHLSSAVNVNTGKLDLNKFSQSLSKAKQNLGDLYKDLSLAGSEGQTAFLNLAKSINAADSSSINLGSKLKELTTTLKNTARWEISSKIMHGFESAISSAYGYAQDLNKSLNDIRIVTGASSDEMAKFAENANKAAKRLSTTTTDYTNASLIYFQQGLNEEEVKKRTDITIKMANAAGQSAEKVSDQMTAIWNNFAKGGENLEYYADVMTALGAATASSTDEIAGGLEKFAAIADTIGLSYEYAASALATITSNTRQSEEVVGTALKTIFARIQGLNLGEALDDGTTLNKYSEALQKVGISIYDSAGGLKDMDNILNEMATKWETLSSTQQVALAQTVAGVRQYTQLVALMDNWNDGSADSMIANLETSYSAEGALQEQADIKAESWEAAQKRVQAAAEGIFQELLNDDFFIDILNGFEGFLTGINNVIDGVGGLKTILLSVGGIFLKQYAKEIPAALSALGSNIDVITGKAEKNRQKMLEENKAELFAQKTTFMNDAQIKELETMRQVSSMTVELEKNRKNLSQAEIEAYEHNIDMAKAYGESSVALAKETKEIEKKLSAQKKQAVSKTDVSKDLVKSNTRITKLKDERDNTTDEEKKLQLTKKINEEIEKRNKLLSKKSNISKDIDDYAKLHKQQQQLTDVQENLKNNAINWAQDTKDLDENSEAMQKYNKKIQDYLDMINQLDLGQDQQGNQIKLNISFEDFQKLSQQLQAVNGDAEKTKQIMEQWSKGLASKINDLDSPLVDLESRLRELNVPDDIIDEIKELAQASGQAGLEAEELKRRLLGLDTPVTHIMQTSEAFGVMASTMMEVWGAIEAVKNLGSIWLNEDLSTGEKMFQTVSAMLPVIVSLTSVLKKNNLEQLVMAGSSIAAATGLGGEATAAAAATVATKGLTASLGTLWAALWPIALIGAAIGAVVAGFAIWDSVTVSAAEKTERLTANVQNMKDAASEAKAKAEGLRDAFDDYQEIQTTLEGCVVGTTEWKTAMEDVKTAIDDILAVYPDLAKVKDLLIWDENTQSYILDTTKVENYIEDSERAAEAIDYGARMAEGMLVENRGESSKFEFDVAKTSVSAYGKAGDSGLQGLSIDRLTGNRDTDIAIIEEALRNDIKSSDWAVSQMDYALTNEDGSYKYNDDGTIQIDEAAYNAEIDSYIESMSHVTDELLGIAEIYHGINSEANTIFTNASKIAVNEKFAGQEGVTEAEINAAVAATANDYDTIFDNLYGTDGTDGTMASAFKKGNSDWDSLTDEGKAILTRYEQAMGHAIDWSDNLVQGNDANRTFHINGQEDGLTPEEIATTIAAYEALGGEKATENQQASMDIISGALGSANNIGDALITAITNGGDKEAMSNFLADFTGEELEALMAGIDETGTISEEALKSVGLTAEQLAQVGEIFGLSANEIGIALLDAGETIQHFTQDQQIALNNSDIKTKGYTVGEQKAFADAKEKAGDYLIEESGNTINFKELRNIENENVDKLPGLTKFYEGISKIDMNSMDASEQIRQLAEEYEISGQSLEAFITEVDNLPKIFDLSTESIFANNAKIQEIINGLETGDMISVEDFKYLEELNIEDLDSYFMRMSDGTYKLIGDAETFYQAVTEQSLEDFKNIIETKNEDNAAIDNVLSYGVTELGNIDSHYQTGDGIYQANTEVASAQLDFLEQTGYDLGKINKWRESMEKGTLNVKELTNAVNHQITALGGAESATEKLKNEQEENNSEIEQSESAILSTAKSLTSLNKKAKENQTSTKSYNKALAGLASQYESCQDEIEAYNKAIKNGDENSEEAKKAIKDLEKALKKAEWDKFTEQALDYAKALKDLTDENEITKNLIGIQEAFKSAFDFDVSLEQLQEYKDDFIAWGESTVEESDDIATAIASKISADNFDLQSWKDKIIELEIDADVSPAESALNDLTITADDVKGYIESYPPTVSATGDADFSAMIAAMLEAGYTAADVAAALAMIGQTNVDFSAWGDGLGSYDFSDPESALQFTKDFAAWSGGLESSGDDSGANVIQRAFPGGDIPQITGSGGGRKPDGNKSGGGGGSKPKKAEPTKKSDIVDRYKEVEDKLDDIREEADRVKNSLDRLYGAEQEAAIERLLELERQEIALMKQKAGEAKKFMQEDLDELMKVSAEVNVEFEVDEKGNLVNYTEEMTELYEELTALETKAGDEWDQKEQEEISALKEKITKLEEAIAAYEETRELLEDINAELDEMAGTPPLPLIKSEYLDVYYEVEDKLDDIEEKIKDLEREAEGLTGEARLEVLRQIQELEEERLKTLEEQKEIARQDMEDKKAAMEEIAERNDLNFEYDENGNITNYISEMEKLNEAYEDLYDQVTEDGLVTDDELAALDAMREDMEQMEEYAQGYRQAMETVEDIQNEIEDKGSGKSNDRFVRSDHIDIYRETNNQLDDIDEKIDDLERQADKLTGEERIAKLKEIQKLEKERLEVLKKQKDIAKADMEDRKAAMEELATLNGLLFDYDENGNITNYEEQMGKKIAEYEEEYTKALKDGVITETEQAILDAIDQDIQELEEAIDEYQDAVEQMEDIQNEMEEITESGYVDMDQLDDIGDKLHDINNTLDDIEDAINDASKAADRLYGEARIKQMNKTAQLIEKEIDALEKKKALQQEIVAEEKAELDEFSKGQVKYDSNGNITNYHEVIDSRKDAIRAEKDKRTNDEDGFTETDAAIVQEMIDELERMEEEMEEYEQAQEDLEDIKNAIDDAYYEWQDLNAEQLSYKLELTLDVNDRELAKIERQISRLEGNFYTRAEALALMVGGGLGGSSKLGELNSQLSDLQGHYAEIKQWYAEGKISHEAYVSMTKEIQGEIEATAAEMEALQDQMETYYKDTLAAARQELSFYTAQMEHLTGVLGHFKNILTSLGKSQDYEMMDVVLRGQVETLENEVEVAKEAMGMWQQEADEAYAKYQQALASGNQENANMYYLAYQEALNAANEAENKYYQKAQQWAEALKALMQNTLSGLAQDLENTLTGGTSFENINNQLKRASSLQEEYLTTTNKIYETTKMMRTAQNEIDKTTNSVAKRKLANFITETKQMQNQNKLSKYELSIQQAKYDLLLAEIALEEARFAKSTVRLRRDAEGNFGYVYTADAEAVANAEQKFEDAQNKLYNVGLEGANKYTEKYQQTLSEMYDTLTSLQNKYLQGGFESEEEYNAAVTEAKEYYYEKLKQYSELYSVAINAESGTLTDTLVNNSRIAADAWSTDFADMTQKTEQWMQAVDGYLVEVRAAFVEWERESDRIANETVGTNLTDLKDKVGDIVTESETLTGTITNSVIPAIQSEINEVQRLTDAYANMAGSMQGAIDKAYALSDALQQDIDASVEQEMAKQDQETEVLEPETGGDSTTPTEPIEDPEPSTEPEPEVPPETPGGDEDNGGDQTPPVDPPHTHSYGSWTTDTPATCTSEGKQIRKCSCGESDVKKIPKLNHKASSTWEKNKTHHWHVCTECGTVMDKAEHTLSNGKCSVCNYEPDKKENGVLEVGDTPTYVSGKYFYDSYGTEPAGSRGQGKKVKVTQVIKSPKAGQDYPIHVESNDSAYGWLKASQLQGYDTGGYTGEWGPFGKLALLHEKELILNKADTENFLASLELLDGILSTIDLYAMNSQFSSMMNSPYIPDLGKEALEQMVSIEASFPNATDKQEIEEAFKDLVNLASQYAHRK